MISLKCPIVLASKSPRRTHLLQMLGWEFSVQVSEAEEIVPENVAPEYVVQSLALQKAEVVANLVESDSLIIAADTVVVLENDILGKPTSEEDAFLMLSRLRGQTHTVFTGIALIHPASKRQLTRYEATEVTFGIMSDAEIRQYIASGSPMDKAGSYGIQDDQGALFIKGIQGDYYNVVGLPLHLLYNTIKEQFKDLMR
jgi:septum formation protein